MFGPLERIKLWEGEYSAALCELEVWIRSDQLHEPTEEEMRWEMREKGRIACADYRRSVGIYPDRPRAEQDLAELHECCWDANDSLDFAIIRQKAVCVQMCSDDCIKEWSYEWGGAPHVDETLARNFDMAHNPFMGRPREMIRHEVGDIVCVLGAEDVHWGIVFKLPPTEEDIALEKNCRLDYRADHYEVLTNNAREAVPECVPSHLTLKPPSLLLPDKVKNWLHESYAWHHSNIHEYQGIL